MEHNYSLTLVECQLTDAQVCHTTGLVQHWYKLQVTNLCLDVERDDRLDVAHLLVHLASVLNLPLLLQVLGNLGMKGFIVTWIFIKPISPKCAGSRAKRHGSTK